MNKKETDRFNLTLKFVALCREQFSLLLGIWSALLVLSTVSVVFQMVGYHALNLPAIIFSILLVLIRPKLAGLQKNYELAHKEISEGDGYYSDSTQYILNQGYPDADQLSKSAFAMLLFGIMMMITGVSLLLILLVAFEWLFLIMAGLFIVVGVLFILLQKKYKMFIKEVKSFK